MLLCKTCFLKSQPNGLKLAIPTPSPYSSAASGKKNKTVKVTLCVCGGAGWDTRIVP